MRRIIGQWGDKPLSQLKVEEAGKFLFALDRSGRYKRSFICAMKKMYREAYWYDCDIPVPSFPTFAKNKKGGHLYFGRVSQTV
jgi:hypothetical protein